MSPNRQVFYMFVSITLCVASLPGLCAEQSPLRAGSATISITPDPSSHDIVLGGYGDRKGKPATGVRDPVMARILYLGQGDMKIAVVACDLDLIPQSLIDAVQERLSASGMEDIKLFMAATHTHASPTGFAMKPENKFKNPALGSYDSWLLNWTADVISLSAAQAVRSSQPARVLLGTHATSGLNRNRRGDSVTDSRLTAIRVEADEDRPIAVLVHFAAHPTILGADMMDISAGWPGVLCRTLEKHLNAGIKAVYLNGAQGDVSPSADEPGTDIERMIIYGRRVSDAALLALDSAEEIDSPSLGYADVTVDLPKRSLSQQFKTIAGEEYEIDEAAASAMISMLFPEKATIRAVRLGSLLLVGVPGEPAASLGLRIREELESSEDVTVLVVGLTGDYVGYILPPDEYDEGGYEATVSFYGRELGTIITDAAIKAGKLALER